MNIITITINKWRNRRKLAKIKAAVKIIEAAGLMAVKIHQSGGCDYIMDARGAWRKIGRR